ncbi:hypothetical protein [Actinomadura decatromicini]|uniref:Copper resistance protein D domain-containing protein n=1 Tax=Actinomadura decatromicini TaxID=2604572 RepID=A0A5D3F9I8_9ACTN|nr:hypothetical protein [Actinomadura decatromicini]TYK44628.1 hypothetical protein FXF68_34875 [Actinomadura decatromicini]
MLAVTTADLRIFLHVLAATIWVGGQITLGALVPALRGYDGVAKAAARRFNAIAWPAFAVLILTGVWNITSGDLTDAAQRTLEVKLVFVLLSGAGAFLHMRATSKAGLAAWGAVGAAGALAALFFGVQLG